MIAKIAHRIAARKPWLEKRGIVIWAALLGALLVLPSLKLGVQADDHTIRMTVHGEPGIGDLGSSWWNAFTFADGNVTNNAARIDWGIIPWWSAPEIKLSFLRPLTALTHALDYWYLEPHLWLMHVENILMYMALCACVAVLYRRSGMTLWVAGLAALLYAVDDAHGIPAGWLAGRNATLTCLFGVLTLIAHDTWRRNKSFAALVWAILALIVGFACGEATIFVYGYLFAYAVCMENGSIKQRVVSLIPYGVVLVVYLATYKALGYGTKNSGLYSDPFGNPIGFAREIALNLPALLQSQLGIISSNTYVVMPQRFQFILHILDIAFIALFFIAFLPLFRTSKLARFWAFGMFLSLPPVCATVPTDRLLAPAGVGGIALVAMFIEFAAARWNNAPTRARRRFEHGMVYFFLFTHAFLAPLSLPFNSTSVRIFGKLVDTGIAALPLDESIVDDSIIIVNPKVDAYCITMPAYQSSRRLPVPRHLWGLDASLGGMTIHRTDASTLEVQVEGGFFPKPFGSCFHGPADPWTVGRVVSVADFDATILELTEDVRPKKIRFAFKQPLENPKYRWFCFRERNLEPFTPPAIGETIILPGRTIIQGIRSMIRLSMSP